VVDAQSATANVNPIGIQSSPVGPRKVLIQHSKQMPEESTVAISEIRNLQGDQFLGELEIEVQNNSSKPIFHLEIDMTFPELVTTELDGIARTFIIPLNFGRHTLMKHGEFAAPAEKSIQPGERYVFKIPEPDLKGIEDHLTKRNIPASSITRISLR